MNALLLTLELKSPVLVSGVGNGEENSSRTLTYIPGAAIRGALASRYQKLNNPQDLPTDEQAQRLFFSGSVRYLNAYQTAGKHGDRSLPLPASWRKSKDEHWTDAEVLDFAFETDPEKDMTLGQQFCSPGMDEQKFVVLDPEQELTIHNASQERGYVRRENSTVFQYQSLARGQVFCAVIIAEEATELAELEKLLKRNLNLQLGRSRSARYGRVRVIDIKKEKSWRETPHDESTIEDCTVITLLSDAALKDQYGEYTRDLDVYLTGQLKKPVRRQSAFLRSVVAGGFNRKWRLPLPQIPALGMGSCFVYPAGMVSPAELKPLVESGIGERTVDGFGRIAVNWPGEARFYLTGSPRAFIEPVILSSSSQKIALFMSERLLRQKLDNELVAHARRFQIRGNIVNHQLSRLRGVLRQAINQGSENVQPVIEFLDGLKKTAEDQFRKARVIQDGAQSGPRLLNWLIERLKKLDGFDLMNFHEKDIPDVTGHKAEITETLKREYTLRLVEAIVDARMKQNRKEGRS